MPHPAPQPSPANVGLVALRFALKPGSKEAQLLPAGEFRADDGSGRPDDIEGGRPWYIDAAAAALVKARAGLRRNRFVIDYEHQTLAAEKNGLPAPAAGWFTGAGLEWREGEGLFATDVEWTARAKGYIESGEYAYISCVFFYDKRTGAVLDIRLAALTNTPGIDGMHPVAALTAALGASAWIDPCGGTAAALPPLQENETLMNELLKKLLAALGLAETTTEASALTAVAALKANFDKQNTELAALKAKPPASGPVDLTQYVPIAVVDGLRRDMAALTAQLGMSDDGVASAVEAARQAGKVWPSEVEYLQNLGKTAGVAALKAQLDARPVIPALAGMQSQAAMTAQHTQQPGGGGNGMTAEGAEVCRQLGLSQDEFRGASGKK